MKALVEKMKRLAQVGLLTGSAAGSRRRPPVGSRIWRAGIKANLSKVIRNGGKSLNFALTEIECLPEGRVGIIQ